MRKRPGYEHHKTSSYGAGPHTPITQRSPDGRPFEKPRPKNRTLLSLNGSDSAALEMLPGIGPVLAARIIRYREKLGGFYQRSQLREVYGIDDSLFAFIAPFFETSPSASALKKIDLNSVSLDNLRQHPYLRWEKAKAIVRYRESNGPFTSVSDLEKIIALDTTTLSRLLPYVVVKATTLSTN
ncbi:MAG: ComEA family DNA-binding protein [Sphingomonadales bacterium]